MVLQQQGFIIIQIDECIFQPNKYSLQHWAPVNEPLLMDQKVAPGETRAVIGAICAEYGLIHTMQKECKGNGFNNRDIKLFLCEMQWKLDKLIPGNKIAIFWDNLSCHRSLTEEIRNGDEPYLRMAIVKNIAYRPDLNGIEHYWGACKREYRLRVDWMKANNVKWSQEKLIEEILWSFPQDFVGKLAGDGWKRLFAAEPVPDLRPERVPPPFTQPITEPPPFIPVSRMPKEWMPLSLIDPAKKKKEK